VVDSAMWTLLGSLGGVGIGSFVTWKIQQRQLAAQERTRFHEQRLEIYTQFTGACNQYMSAMQVGPQAAANATSAHVLLIAAFEKLRMCGSTNVFNAATAVHAICVPVMTGQANANQVGLAFNARMAELVVEARKELGID